MPGPYWEDLLACYRLLRRELTRVLDRHGMLLSDFRALQHVEEGPATLGQVAIALGLSPATLTSLARGLEKRGWIDRQRSTADRRASLLRATSSGLRALREARQDYYAGLRGIEGGLAPLTHRNLPQGLRELRALLESLRENEERVPARE